MKVKLFKIKNEDEFASKILETWPAYIPKPKVEIINDITCDEEPFIIVSEKEVKVNDCAGLWARPDPQDIVIKAIELNYAITEKSITRRTFITGRQVERFIRLPKVNESCLAPFGCSQCVFSCPSNAISVIEGKVKIDENKCTYCGLCSASCPIGAISLAYPTWNSITLMTKVIKKGKITVSCDASKADLLVPCLGVLGPEEIYSLYSFYDLDLICPNENCVNRRAALNAINIFNEVKEKMKIKPSTYLTGVKRADYTRVISSANISGKSSFDIHAYRVIMTEDCTLCGVCVRKCPTKAFNFSIKDSKLMINFNPSKCVGCNACVSLCEEDAIIVTREYDYSSLHEGYSYVTAEDEIVKCKRCGKPFDNKKKILRVASILNVNPEDLEYCNECKQVITAERILKTWKDKFGDVRRGYK